jgi:hypothetical protein
MGLLHHSSTDTFSGVLVDPHEQLLRIKQPSYGTHATVREALGQEVVKDQGDLVVLDHLWSLYELFRYKVAPPLGGAEATRLSSQGPFEYVHCLKAVLLARRKAFIHHLPTTYPRLFHKELFSRNCVGGCCLIQVARRS